MTDYSKRRVEVWSHPADAAGFRLLCSPPVLDGSNTGERDDAYGKGTLVIPADYEHRALIIESDPTDPGAANDSVIAWFMPGATLPYFECWAEEAVETFDDKGQSILSISGSCLRSAPNEAIVYPRAPGDPIWLWGQPTLTRNPDLTEGFIADEEFEIWVVASAGSFRIDLGASGWSAPIYISDAQAIWTNATGGTLDVSFDGEDASWAWNANAATVKAALEGMPNDVITDVTVTGAGTAGDPWVVVFVDPAGPQPAISLDASSLTPGGSFGFWEDRTASAAFIKSVIEAGPSSVVEINVTGAGIPASPWKLHIVDPAQTDYSVQVDDTSLTGDIFVRFVSDGGEVKPTYWTPAQTVDGVLFGVQGAFEVVTDPDDGLPALLVAGNSASIGAQQILSGVAGVHGYATVEIKALVYGANFRLGIRDIDEAWLYTVEDFIDAETFYTTLTIPDVQIPEIIDQIILRVATIDDAPPDFLLRNLKFHPGFPGTTAGDIVQLLMAPAVVRGVLEWLELDSFDAVNDSTPAVWDEPALTFRADPTERMADHVLGELGSEGYEYEFDVVRLPTPPGGFSIGAATHALHMWNPGGRSAATVTTAIVIGSAITGGRVAKRRVAATHVLVEYGSVGQTIEVTLAALAGLPRREDGLRAEYALDEASAIRVGEAYLQSQVDNMLAVQSALIGNAVVPYRDFDIGSTVPHELGRHAARHDRRVHAISSRLSAGLWRDEVVASELFAGEEAADELTRRMWLAFKRDNRAKGSAVLPQFLGGGGAHTYIFSLPGQAFLESGRLRFYFPFGGAVQWSLAAVHVAPSGADLIVDVNVNGTSIFPSPANRPTIPDGLNVSPVSQIGVSIPALSYVTVDVDQVGSTIPGGDVTVMVACLGATG